MTLVFGANWKNDDYKKLSARWKEFKEKQDAHFDYRPTDKAKIVAKEIKGTVGSCRKWFAGGFLKVNKLL